MEANDGTLLVTTEKKSCSKRKELLIWVSVVRHWKTPPEASRNAAVEEAVSSKGASASSKPQTIAVNRPSAGRSFALRVIFMSLVLCRAGKTC